MRKVRKRSRFFGLFPAPPLKPLADASASRMHQAHLEEPRWGRGWEPVGSGWERLGAAGSGWERLGSGWELWLGAVGSGWEQLGAVGRMRAVVGSGWERLRAAGSVVGRAAVLYTEASLTLLEPLFYMEESWLGAGTSAKQCALPLISARPRPRVLAAP
eukprot:3445700-Prymnesium_polylepis.2